METTTLSPLEADVTVKSFWWERALQSSPASEGFRSEDEIKALRILDEMEEEQNNLLLIDLGGKRCAKRQRLIYDEAMARTQRDELQEIADNTI